MRGEAQVGAKLTDASVQEIRELSALGGMTYRQLGERYGVSTSLVGLIVRRLRWAHVC